jgi:NAD(P)-dependent dehydrogenase (short-subunit alcohol dehydrogenase family)
MNRGGVMTEARWALVVGASRGLGLGLAAELRRRGWNVVGTVRDAAGERRLAELPAETGGDPAGRAARHQQRCRGRRVAPAPRWQVFDLVFVNAGIAPQGRGDAASASREEAAAVFLTNAVSPARLARAFVDRVRDGPVVIAFMSSGLGSVANKTDSYGEFYSASKAALNSLSRSLAASLGRRRITVLAVAPGWVRTDMGGPGAPLIVEQSVSGIVDVLESRAGTGRHGFVDYRGREVAW